MLRAYTHVLLSSIVASLPLAVIARADGPGEEVRIEYDGPRSCPSEEDFLVQIRARTQRLRRATGTSPARTFRVILKDGVRPTGHLDIENLDGTRASRDVEGDRCEGVVSALALITALAVDPNALIGQTPPEGPPAASTEAPLRPSPVASSTLPAPLLPPPTPATPLATPPVAAGEREAPHGRGGWALAVAADAAVVVGVSPRALVGVPLFLEASDLLIPTLRLGFERALSGTLDEGAGQAAFTWTVGMVEVCPVELGERWSHRALRLEPCVRFEGGALEGAGSRVVPSHDVTSTWLDVGALARAEWFVLRPLFLEVEGGLRTPLIRTRFFFEPDATIYKPSLVGSVVGVGAGARFW